MNLIKTILNEKVDLPPEGSPSKKAVDDKWINIDN
jgi:hypothetical protein